MPDLGPKLNSAFASSEAENSYGTTRLHLDMSDAVNVMLYASPDRHGKPGTAVWDLYRSEDLATIREFLCKRFGDSAEDPIHSEKHYLDATSRKELYAKHRIMSWRVYQRPGDAVFIPAGCAYQVRQYHHIDLSLIT